MAYEDGEDEHPVNPHVKALDKKIVALQKMLLTPYSSNKEKYLKRMDSIRSDDDKRSVLLSELAMVSIFHTYHITGKMDYKDVRYLTELIAKLEGLQPPDSTDPHFNAFP